MDRRVWHPGAVHRRPPDDVCDGEGIFPGRIPFMDAGMAKPPQHRYSHEAGSWFRMEPGRMWRIGERDA
jgi:hypothetical protein